MAGAVELGPERAEQGDAARRGAAREQHEDDRAGRRVDQGQDRETGRQRQQVERQQPGGPPAVDRPAGDQRQRHRGRGVDRIAGGEPGEAPAFDLGEVHLVEEHAGDHEGRRQNAGQQSIEQRVAEHLGTAPLPLLGAR